MWGREPDKIIESIRRGESISASDAIVYAQHMSKQRIAELEAALRLCVGAMDRWQGAAPLSEAQVQARAALAKST